MNGGRLLRRALLIPICLSAVLSVAAQNPQRQVEVVKPEDRELKRAAYHLSVDVETLQRSRRLIEEATQLFMGAALTPVWDPSLLANAWLRADNRKAVDKIEAIVNHLRDLARESGDSEVYRWATQSAAALLRRILENDPPRYLLLFSKWPLPVAPTPDDEQVFESAFSELKARDCCRCARFAHHPTTPAAARMLR